jgi:hypothetical protein
VNRIKFAGVNLSTFLTCTPERDGLSHAAGRRVKPLKADSLAKDAKMTRRTRKKTMKKKEESQAASLLLVSSFRVLRESFALFAFGSRV